MKQLLIRSLLIAVLLYVGIKAGKLSGEDLEDAVDILSNALGQLRKKNGPYFTLIGVKQAFKFAPNVIYTFDAQLLDPFGKLDYCIVELSADLVTTLNSLVVISCGGEEKVRKVLQEKIELNDL